jgi:hypothetical protein
VPPAFRPADRLAVRALSAAEARPPTTWSLRLQANGAVFDAITKGRSLLESDFPTDFKSIVQETIVCAPDAVDHPMTRELASP